MGKKTKIPLADSVLDLVDGCSAGCEIPRSECWAACNFARWQPARDFTVPELYLERLAEALRWPDLTGKRREKVVVLPYTTGEGASHDELCPVRSKRQDKLWLDGHPRTIFCCSKGEPFDAKLPRTDDGHHWLCALHGGEGDTVLDLISDSPHRWIFLTKQPQNIPRIEWPRNVWLGVSVTDQATADARIPELLKRGQGAGCLFVSAEPMRSPIDLRPYMPYVEPGIVPIDAAKLKARTWREPAGISWVIAGKGTGVKGWSTSFTFGEADGPFRCQHKLSGHICGKKSWSIVLTESEMKRMPAKLDRWHQGRYVLSHKLGEVACHACMKVTHAWPYDPAWAADLEAQCKRAGVAFFAKDVGTREMPQ